MSRLYARFVGLFVVSNGWSQLRCLVLCLSALLLTRERVAAQVTARPFRDRSSPARTARQSEKPKPAVEANEPKADAIKPERDVEAESATTQSQKGELRPGQWRLERLLL